MQNASTPPLRVIQVGLGPIGQKTVAYVAERDGVELVAAVDIDPAKAGQDAGTLAGIAALGVTVTSDFEAGLQVPADVVLLTTGSRFASVVPQLEACLAAGKAVVSTCEELAFPFAAEPELAARVDALARRAGVAVLGTGVNPGFLMDALPIFLTSVCRRVDVVRVERWQDAAIRRLPFQQKIGAGLSPEAFADQVRQGVIKHVGFAQSIQMIAGALGWQLDHVEDEVLPVVATQPVSSPFLRVEAGQCAGVHQTGRGFRGGQPVITLELQAYLGHPAPHDAVIIHGDPDVHSTIAGGVNGDIATCAMVLNALKSVRRAAPGLRTMADVPLTHWYTR
jgi:4-hydroxy-tetrahydrodipicolinate reductase